MFSSWKPALSNGVYGAHCIWLSVNEWEALFLEQLSCLGRSELKCYELPQTEYFCYLNKQNKQQRKKRESRRNKSSCIYLFISEVVSSALTTENKLKLRNERKIEKTIFHYSLSKIVVFLFHYFMTNILNKNIKYMNINRDTTITVICR